MPSWFKTERNTAARQNLLLLQRYVDAYKAAHGDYPATGSLTPETLAGSALRLAKKPVDRRRHGRRATASATSRYTRIGCDRATLSRSC